MLTERGSEEVRGSQEWDFGEGSQNCDEIKGIESLLAKEGLLDVFNCFQNFRAVMI